VIVESIAPGCYNVAALERRLVRRNTMGLGIREFDTFIRGEFRKRIREAYKFPEIFCESDLQSLAWTLIRDFVNQSGDGKMRVLNRPYFKDLKLYPDLVVFKRNKPWVVVELKEKKQMGSSSIEKEKKKILRVRDKIRRIHAKHPKRGYLIWVSRYATVQVMKGPKGDGAKFYFEIPIALDEWMSDEEIREWYEKRFKPFARFMLPGKTSGVRRSVR
jgi:hypothetical protein